MLQTPVISSMPVTKIASATRSTRHMRQMLRVRSGQSDKIRAEAFRVISSRRREAKNGGVSRG